MDRKYTEVSHPSPGLRVPGAGPGVLRVMPWCRVQGGGVRAAKSLPAVPGKDGALGEEDWGRRRGG